MLSADLEAVKIQKNDNVSSFTSSLNSRIGSRKSQSEAISRRFYYTVGPFNILIEQDLKVENLQALTINTVPHSPEWCIGITSVRGVIMPVVDMHILINTQKNSTTKINSIMLEHKNHAPIIFQTDGLPQATDTNQYTFAEIPKNAPKWIKKHLKNGSCSIFETDHNQLLKLLS